jgi:hypothetical protein
VSQLNYNSAREVAILSKAAGRDREHRVIAERSSTFQITATAVVEREGELRTAPALRSSARTTMLPIEVAKRQAMHVGNARPCYAPDGKSLQASSYAVPLDQELVGPPFPRPMQRFYQVDGVPLKILSVGSMRRKKVASVRKAIQTPRVKYTRTVMRQAVPRSTPLGGRACAVSVCGQAV